MEPQRPDLPDDGRASAGKQRHWRNLAVVVAVVAAGAVGFLAGRQASGKASAPPVASVSSTTTTLVGTTSSTESASDQGPLKSVAGTWIHHGFHMTIDAAGFGTFQWRTYEECGQSPSACDLSIGNLIIDGGYATFSATLKTPNVLSGEVVATTETKAVPFGHFTARLRNGVDIIDLVIGGETLEMCGPNAPTPNDCGA